MNEAPRLKAPSERSFESHMVGVLCEVAVASSQNTPTIPYDEAKVRPEDTPDAFRRTKFEDCQSVGHFRLPLIFFAPGLRTGKMDCGFDAFPECVNRVRTR